MPGTASQSVIQRARSRCLRKFRYYFKQGFQDAHYIAWERQYKWDAHLAFQEVLHRAAFKKLLNQQDYQSIAQHAVKIESGTNLLFSFEKMALRDAIKPLPGAKAFATGLFDYLYGTGTLRDRFESWIDIIGNLPRVQTKVLSWPLVTVFGFIAQPNEHIFLKPRVTQRAAEKYQFDFRYASKPNWQTYENLLSFAEQIRLDAIALKPKDFIDLQSFIWVLGSDEYPD